MSLDDLFPTTTPGPTQPALSPNLPSPDTPPAPPPQSPADSPRPGRFRKPRTLAEADSVIEAKLKPRTSADEFVDEFVDDEVEPTPAPLAMVLAPAPALAAARAQRDGEVTLVMPTTSFDFLEGRYRAAARMRMLHFLVGALTSAAVGLLLIFTGTAYLQTGQVERTVADTQTRAAQVQSELDAARGGGAATQDDVDSHVLERASLAVTAAQNQIDYARVIASVLGLNGAVTVESITFSTPETADAVAVVQVTGSAATLQDASGVTDAFGDKARFPFFTKIDGASSIQCGSTTSRSSTACSWSWKGTASPEVLGPRVGPLEDTFPGATPLAPAAPSPNSGPTPARSTQ